MAIYFQPARHLRARAHTHTRPYSLSRSRFNAVSFFNSDSSSLETHPSCRVTHPRGHVDRDTPTFYRLLDTLRRHESPRLSAPLATHWHETNLCKGASIDFTEIVFETSCWETFGKFLGWFSDLGVKVVRATSELSVIRVEVRLFEEVLGFSTCFCNEFGSVGGLLILRNVFCGWWKYVD